MLQYEDYGVEYDQYDEHYDDVGRGGGQGNYIQSEVKKFLQYFYEIFTKGDSFELTKLYEQTFPKLTESFFKTQPWPEVEELLSFLPDDNSLFFIIYKELYFRHIYARVQGGPSIEQRYTYLRLYVLTIWKRELKAFREEESGNSATVTPENLA